MATSVKNMDDTSSLIEVISGRVFYIELPENPTTGYRWQLPTTPHLQLISSDFHPDFPEKIGSAGIRRFGLILKSRSSMVLRLVLKREWEDPAKVIEEKTYTIVPGKTGRGGAK